MYLKNIRLENYRCFEDLSIDLDSKCTIIIGNNSAGKSTILDAVAVSLSAFTSAFDGIYGVNIFKSDARLEAYESGSRIVHQPIYPVRIHAHAEMLTGESLKWSRTLRKSTGRTTTIDAFAAIEFAHELENKVIDRSMEVILPVIAYYGTGRLWMRKREHWGNQSKNFLRTMGYSNCMDSASDEKRMLEWMSQMTFQELQDGNRIPELDVVLHAMEICYKSAFAKTKEVHIRFDVKSNELIASIRHETHVESLPLRSLSDGIKTTLSMVADIAYRMAILNPDLLEDILIKTPGVIIIDEIDMHLHPKWQKSILQDLGSIFPNVQFIVSTHAPSVIANVKETQLRILENHKLFDVVDKTYGKNIDEILRYLMDVNVKPIEIQNLWDEFAKAFGNEELEKGKCILDKLIGILGNDNKDIVDAQTMLELESIGLE